MSSPYNGDERRKAYMGLESDILSMKKDIQHNRELLEKDLKFIQSSVVEHIKDDKISFDTLSKKLDLISNGFVSKPTYNNHIMWYKGINVVIFLAIVSALVRVFIK